MWLRAILGVVYTAMAAGQVASFTRMPAIVGELVCGLWLLARPRSHALAPVWVYTAVSGVWRYWACRPNCGG